MTTSLEDALNGKVSETEEPNAPEMEAEAVEAEAVQETVDAGEQPELEQPEDAEAKSQPRDKKGKFAKKSEKAEPEKSDADQIRQDVNELQRQNMERELEALRREREQWQAQQAQKAQPRIDPIDNPEAYDRHVQARIDQAVTQNKLQMSELMARQAHGNEAFDAANAWLLSNPDAVQRFIAESDPWGAAIQAHKRHLAAEEIGDDPQAFRERVEAEVREKLQAEMQSVTPDPKTMPANFATTRNAGARKGPEWAGPTSLEDALRR